MAKIIKRLQIEGEWTKIPAVVLVDTQTCWSLIKEDVAKRIGARKRGLNSHCLVGVQVDGRVVDGKFRVLEKLPRDVDIVVGLDLMLKGQFFLDKEKRDIVFET